MPKITIETTGQDVTISIVTEGRIHLQKQEPYQAALPIDDTPKDEEKEKPRYNQYSERMPSEAQIFTLKKHNLYSPSVTAQEAFLIIKDIKEREERKKDLHATPEPPSEPLPWEQPQPVNKKRGRPRKNGML